jgi:Transketolase, C-terminal subunit
MRLFGKKYPERFFNVGVAEMNMASTAAGLATTGMIPFISSFAVFISLRSCEPIRTMISYPCTNVKMLGGYAGLTAMQHGPTHHCLEDIAVMRVMPNIVILSPSDSVSTERLVEAAVEYNGPVYIRIGYNRQEALYKDGDHIEIGKAYTLREGKDMVIFSTGLITLRVLKAAMLLEDKGISVRVVDCPTIKPLPEKQILKAVEGVDRVMTIEEHNMVGGFGSSIAELLSQKKAGCKLKIMGIKDMFTESAQYEELLDHYGLGIEDIIQNAMNMS